MPDDNKVDLFHPQQPSIPGVDSSDAKAKQSPPAPAVYSPDWERPKPPPSPLRWVALVVLGAFFLLGGGFFYWMRSSSAKTTGAAVPIESAPPVDLPAAAKPAESLPQGPGAIATTAELPHAWSSKRFVYRDLITAQLTPAMVVRLPGGEYWGLSMREPFGTCELEFVTDTKRLSSQYGVKADHPMVADPCNRTVYDLLKYGGGAPDGGLVRGEIVDGTGIRPPMAIEIRVKGKDLIATRME